MRIVLDTNVIVAAFATRGICSEVFEVCLSEHTIIISEHILFEVKDKLQSKIKLPKDITHDIIGYLRESAEICEPQHVSLGICRDKDDLKIIGTALSGNADFMITGDDDLLTSRKYDKTKIVSPRKFWDYLRRYSR